MKTLLLTPQQRAHAIRYTLILVVIGLLFTGNPILGQSFRVQGRITDMETGEPLAFVSLVLPGGKLGAYSDIDGKYQLQSNTPFTSFKASYVGYLPKEIQVNPKESRHDFSLLKTAIELTEVIIVPKENPAHRIIRKTIENKDMNDPSKLSSFSYTAYEKLIFTSDLDSIARVDTTKQDSSMIRARQFFDKQYLALIENVVERSFQAPAKSQQKVIATKVSGLKDPIFVFLLSQLQPVSFYEDIISLGSQRLINPISKGSLSKYFFLIRDTIYNPDNRDTTFVIYFRPFKGTNFDGLSGLLYINTDKYAIQNVIANPSREEKSMSIKIQQMYEKVDGENWFPVQLNTDISFKGIELVAGEDSSQRYYVIGKGRSYLQNIEINGKGKKKYNHIEILIDPEAARREEIFWEKFRTDSLTAREKRTYVFMDSLGKAEKLDNKARNLETMMTGRIPIGLFDVELNKLFRYNEYEKYYFGLGLVTNRRWSDWWRMGGYWGYGTKDERSKYGGNLSIMPLPEAELEIRLSYRKDIRESGGVTHFDDNSMLVYERFRNFLITKMDYDENRQFSVSFRALKYWKVFASMNQVSRKTGYPYYFAEQPVSDYTGNSTFHFSEILSGFRFAYKEKFLKNARTQISMGTKYPIVYFQYARGLEGVFKGEFDYHKFDVKITKSFYFKYIGKSSLCLNFGLVAGELPYTDLYNGNGSYRQFTIYTPNSFATMRMNEFLSDRYAALYFTHNFGKLLVRQKYFQPEIAISTNVAIGSLAQSNVHHLVDFNTLEKGYLESGILLNNLLNLGLAGIGVGGYYRYGAYAFPSWQDNVSLKFSLLFPF